jgi:hypothetical protein
MGREKEKSNELGFHVVTAILSPLSLYGGHWKTKLPLLVGYTPPKVTLGILIVAPSEGCPATAPRFTSTQALRPRHVSSTLKSLGAPRPRLRLPSLQSWNCGSTKKPWPFCGEPPQAPRTLYSLYSNPTHDLATISSRLGVGLWSKPTKSHVQTSVVSRYPALAPPWFWGSTKKPYLTSSCFSCHHAARTWFR